MNRKQRKQVRKAIKASRKLRKAMDKNLGWEKIKANE